MQIIAGGYPGNPGPNPDNPGGLSREDCTIVKGFSEALCFAFRTDNSGPPESLQVDVVPIMIEKMWMWH